MAPSPYPAAAHRAKGTVPFSRPNSAVHQEYSLWPRKSGRSPVNGYVEPPLSFPTSLLVPPPTCHSRDPHTTHDRPGTALASPRESIGKEGSERRAWPGLPTPLRKDGPAEPHPPPKDRPNEPAISGVHSRSEPVGRVARPPGLHFGGRSVYWELVATRRLASARCGSNSVGRVSASQADCRGFESLLPLSPRPVVRE